MLYLPWTSLLKHDVDGHKALTQNVLNSKLCDGKGDQSSLFFYFFVIKSHCFFYHIIIAPLHISTTYGVGRSKRCFEQLDPEYHGHAKYLSLKPHTVNSRYLDFDYLE